jgi:hypothetical protein
VQAGRHICRPALRLGDAAHCGGIFFRGAPLHASARAVRGIDSSLRRVWQQQSRGRSRRHPSHLPRIGLRVQRLAGHSRRANPPLRVRRFPGVSRGSSLSRGPAASALADSRLGTDLCDFRRPDDQKRRGVTPRGVRRLLTDLRGLVACSLTRVTDTLGHDESSCHYTRGIRDAHV